MLDGTGELEVSSGKGRSSFEISYSVVVRQNQKRGTVESIAICNTPVELDHGRVFIVDLSSESPMVNQFEYPLPNALGDSRHCDKKVRKLLNDLTESIAKGHANKRLLKLRSPSNEEKPNAGGTDESAEQALPRREMDSQTRRCCAATGGTARIRSPIPAARPQPLRASRQDM